ncbi:DUF1643 domain-containing protein [Halobacillus trueperi]|uniref:DUF1643 domain-containing protein n=1 Tax=Halobacillus trueperi TaxID=156205 RepID=UPI003734CE84
MSLPSGCRYWYADEKVNAVMDESGDYRYLLKCQWDDHKEGVTFVMLNPSYADIRVCDRTINRCLGFSRSWGYGRMNVVNLFALRSKNPDHVRRHPDPIGTDNDRYILEAAYDSELLIFAWGGNHCSIKNRDREVQVILSQYEPHCIKKTANGIHPRHPLYLKKDLNPIPF